ncbi:MAG: GDSL-type esterase/lipase family protein [Bacteroidales bacterium]|nr:GDSL-type esterase/lipase family protein [Lachnoclostridium sp.]MCM1384960.1 GDSL-type esterase/lipase family protein [Lachnoclostridium sp.]MCM1465848.1 GDSL-type esterase/lipase family protein [Bacteroidales bacterium]
MKKVENRIKKWSFLLVFMLCGVCYLTVMDGWKVYGKELDRIKERYEKTYGKTYGIGSQKQEAENGEKDAGLLEGNDIEPLGEQSSTDVLEELGQENAPDTEPLETEDSLYRTVEDDYFSDAVFIGDSRTVGMFEYGGLEEISTFYASKGLTVYKLFDAPVVSVEGKKKKITVEEALSNNQFSKIYLMVGINEMGTGTVDTFLAKYKEVVEHLQELQPDAIVYIQGIIKVTTERSGEGDYITNEGIEARNQGLEQLADNEKVFYLDVNPLICDETGGMVDSYTFDGVHLKAQYIPIWKDFLKCHAV